MKKKYIPLAVSTTYTVDICGLLYDSSPSDIFSGTLRIDMAMSIIDMYDRKVLSTGRQSKKRGT
jgi:hypothetical protein